MNPNLEACYGALPSCYNFDPASEFQLPFLQLKIRLCSTLYYAHTREKREREREVHCTHAIDFLNSKLPMG